jgi:hypothetical protein
LDWLYECSSILGFGIGLRLEKQYTTKHEIKADTIAIVAVTNHKNNVLLFVSFFLVLESYIYAFYSSISSCYSIFYYLN